MMKHVMAAVAAIALTGCAGSVNGTVGGVGLNVADAIFAILKDDQGKSQGAFVLISDKPKMCDSLKANRQPKQATYLQLTLFSFSATDYLAPDVGDFTVTSTVPMSAGSYAFADFNRTDSNCTSTIASATGEGKSGLIKLQAIKGETGGNAAGTIDITFGSGDKVTGNFNASYCDITKLSSTTPNCE